MRWGSCLPLLPAPGRITRGRRGRAWWRGLRRGWRGCPPPACCGHRSGRRSRRAPSPRWCWASLHSSRPGTRLAGAPPALGCSSSSPPSAGPPPGWTSWRWRATSRPAWGSRSPARRDRARRILRPTGVTRRRNCSLNSSQVRPHTPGYKLVTEPVWRQSLTWRCLQSLHPLHHRRHPPPPRPPRLWCPPPPPLPLGQEVWPSSWLAGEVSADRRPRAASGQRWLL